MSNQVRDEERPRIEVQMTKSRLEAFSDGVIAILITIMVLELKVPHGSRWADLEPVLPIFLSYVLSFVNLGIYWNNHHHLLHAARHVNGNVLWANLHLLFWLSLVPFTTGWMGENHFAAIPTSLFGVPLLMAGVAFAILEKAIIRADGKDSPLRRAIGNATKERLSVVAYAVAIPGAFLRPWISHVLIIGVALMWLVPDRRIENRVESHDAG